VGSSKRSACSSSARSRSSRGSTGPRFGERELGELELLDRRQAGVQHERGAPQAQLVDGAVELVGCQRRQEGERDGDPQMAGGE
jgi:hypothetical protein